MFTLSFFYEKYSNYLLDKISSISNPNSLYETLKLCSLHCAVIRVTFHNSSVTPKRIRTKIYWSFLDIALKEPRAGVDFFRVIYLKWIEIISKKPHWHTIKHFFVKKLWEVIWRDFCRPAKQLWVWHFDQNKKKGKRKW